MTDDQWEGYEFISNTCESSCREVRIEVLKLGNLSTRRGTFRMGLYPNDRKGLPRTWAVEFA